MTTRVADAAPAIDGATTAAVAAPVAATGGRFTDRYFLLLTLVLAGYAIGSKGFAYVGVPPLFIGEITLVLGLVAISDGRGLGAVLRSRRSWLLLAFMGWGMVRTAPYVSTYGLMAVRDAMLWGYACYALILATLLVRQPRRLGLLLLGYRRFVPVFLVGALVVWPATILLRESGLTWPWADVPIVDAKATDLLVHLAGVVAFMSLGLLGRPKPWQIALLVCDVVATGFNSRGGLLAFLVAFAVALAARPRNRTSWSVAAWAAGAVLLLAATGLEIRFPGLERSISFEQFAEHFASTAGKSEAKSLEGTKEWRLAWWAVIVNYTVFGEYRWAGKGYGVNLAEDDGFVVDEANSLRSPHNVHMTVLARTGLVGVAIWLALHVGWLASMIGAARRARRAGDEEWTSTFVFLIAYWLAALVNGTFDVYIEGPMGGILLWSIVGAGIGATILYDRTRTSLIASAPGTSTAAPDARS